MAEMPCDFCDGASGDVLWQDPICRVVLVDDARFPGFCRVVLGRHAREMTDLDAAERAEVMRVVFAVERAVRDVCRPDKVNVASLGNVTPHVHWHVIPRWHDDSHFPDPIWAGARRAGAARDCTVAQREGMMRALRSHLAGH